ncbi:hypothetical protein DCC85_01830 [Paenibacillus sp. CAA11]|uniref:hypothetical protein n=1 Tax=Paenibacillus sp. CAA11 TaxID=1532905 RepID=UPI000D36AC5C|nr:hypothetical protein [Paenibacillus sp. CAA11]AWB43094.1 hypothetical protein DCC85_01830 [Paenibacillus sp. CAA11]
MKRYVSVILIWVMSFSLYGCGAGESKMSIYSDEERLTEEGDSYTFVDEEGEVTAERVRLKYRGFSGVYTPWHLSSTKDTTTTLQIEGKEKLGNFKLILVTADKVETLWKGGKTKALTIQIPKGESMIRWVGQKSAGNLTMTLKGQEGLTVTASSNVIGNSKW